MIWFFIAGWIAGAVFMILFAGWWMKTHAKRVSVAEAMNELKQLDWEKSFYEEHKEENTDDRT